MPKYNVHYSGYYAYDIEVEADDMVDALEKADLIFDDTDPNEFVFEPSPTDMWEK